MTSQTISKNTHHFRERIAAVRQACDYWVETPRKPEAQMMKLLVDSIEAMGEQCLEAQLMCERMTDECRVITLNEMNEVNRILRQGASISRQIQTIDEKTIKAKVAEIMATIRHDIAASMNSQIRHAGTCVKRDQLMQQAAWFGLMISGGILFGIVLDHYR